MSEDPPEENNEPAASKSSGRTSVAEIATRVSGHGASEMVAIGIDLGTSNTCASLVRDGKAEVMPTRYGSKTIPSIVALGDGGRPIVGEAAAKRMILYPHETVYGSKRLVGRAFRAEVAREYQKHFAWKIVETESHRYGAEIGGTVMSMADVSRYILAEIREMAERNLEALIKQVVITVPAHFNEVQRDTVRNAAKEAGLRVARVVNEPTAAAVAYGFNRNEDKRLAVFDLGGGTFDISILEVKDNSFQVIATGGDNFLGGFDVDELIAEHLLQDFRARERITLDLSPQQVARVRDAAEEAKRGLSVQNRVVVQIPQFAVVNGEPRDLSVTVDRAFVEDSVKPLVERMVNICDMVMKGAGIDEHTIDEVVLVGGMTRMPYVQLRVETFFGKKPSRRINPDEAVALGAAILAEESHPVALLDVLPISLGIPAAEGKFLRLLRANTQVPCARAFVVSTQKDNQREFSMPIFQGEREEVQRNEYLGTVVIQQIPEGPRGFYSYELELRLDDQCILTVAAKDTETGRDQPVVLDRTMSVRDVLLELGIEDERSSLPHPVQQTSAWHDLWAWFSGFFRRG